MDFSPGQMYSRADIKEIAGLPRTAKGSNWDTGVVQAGSEFIIFANIGDVGRTGHDYANSLDGQKFRWFHKAGSRVSWPSVQRIIAPGTRVHLFYRHQNDQPFEYGGMLRLLELVGGTPCEIVWETAV